MFKKLNFSLLPVVFIFIVAKVYAQENIKTDALELSIQRNLTTGLSGKASGENMLQFSNYSLESVFKEILSKDFEVKINDPKLKKERLDILMKTKSISLEEGKELLLENLLKRYKLKTNRMAKMQEFLVLSLIDKVKLTHTIANKQKKNGVLKKEEFIDNQLVVSHFSIDEFAQSLSTQLNIKVENKAHSDTYHNFSVPLSSLIELEKRLETFGLKLTKEKKMVSITMIE